ncbi:MAG: M28 family peptidase [Gemmatimonadetes bacterium]|nr:M28 family peptidase [Gemmatimonadota bacterium]
MHPRRPISLLVVLVASAAVTVPASGQKGSAARADQKPVWPDEGAAVWAPRPTVADITPNDLRTRLYGFADDSMMGRRIGELGNYKGTAYVAAEFERLGLKPAGEGGTYFQNLPYGPMGFDKASSQLRIGGRAASTGQDWIPLTPSTFNGLGGTADLSNVVAVFAGTWGDQTPLDPAVFNGKVVVFAGGPPAGFRMGRGRGGGGAIPSCDSVPDRFGADAAVEYEEAMRAQAPQAPRGRGGAGFARDTRAVDAGAAAVLFVNLDDQPGAANAAFAQRSGMRPDPSPAGVPAGASITRATAERIFGRPVDELTVGAQGRAVSGHWDYAWHMSEWPARNVIAILPGSDPARAGEYVLVSAHNDHNGVNNRPVDHDSLRAVNKVTRPQGANDPVCRPNPVQLHEIDSLIARARSIRPPRMDSIMNGADDDGSGTVIMLEVAERFAAEHPARSIIFVSHEGEEAGLLGSRWFTDHPTIPLDSIAGALNMDMEAKGHVGQVKFGGPTSIQILGARRLSREFGGIIDSVNAVRPVVMAVDHSWDVPANPLNRFCRSDQVNYVHHDVPVAYFSTGYSEDYHQPTDEPEYADYDHMAKIGGFIHDIAMAIATRKDRPKIAGADPNYPQCR